jgi:hypothetical protein
MRSNKTLLLTFLLALAPACGSEGTTSATAGFDQGKMLSSLSAADQKKLCEQGGKWLSANSASSKEGSCRLAGSLASVFGPENDAELRAACKKTYDACLKAPEKTESSCTTVPATCKATVAEFDACLKAVPGYFDGLFKGLPTCDQLTVKSLGQKGSSTAKAPEPPAACKTFQTKCPGLSLIEMIESVDGEDVEGEDI